uniref:Uncharacterized protein n=1 Tax=Magallana gigas TaxID=29159 RepID=K1PPG4_MAGGI
MEMGLSEVFFPHGNFQDGFGFAMFIWVIGFTRGIASYDDFLVYIPVIEEIMNETFFLDPVPIQNSSSCVITIPAMSENGTSGGLVNLTLLNSELGQQDLSDILNGSRGGVIGERSSFGHIYLKQPKGDLTPLYDVTNGSRQYLVPVNIFNNTKICLYSGFDSVTYEIFVFNSTLVPEMLAFKVRKELHSFSTDCLLAGDMDSDVIFVNSSKQFGVMLIKPEVLPIPGSNRALESIPNTDYMRTEFVMVTDEESEIFLMGLENSDVRVETQEDEFNFTVMAHSVKKLNVKANLTLQLTSSKPIQVMCLTSMKTLQNMSFLNLFTVFPLERSFCNWFEISSSCVVEPCVIVVTKKMDNYPSVSINGSLVRATNYSFSDYHILEIANLQNGLHFLNVTNSAGLAVYVFDRDRARLYHVPPLNQNKCSEFVKSSSSSSVNNGDDKFSCTNNKASFPEIILFNVSKCNTRAEDFPAHFDHQTSVTAFRVSGHPQDLHDHTPDLDLVQHATGAGILSPADTCTRVQLHVRSVSCVDYLGIMLRCASTQPFLAIPIRGKLTRWRPTTNVCSKTVRPRMEGPAIGQYRL